MSELEKRIIELEKKVDKLEKAEKRRKISMYIKIGVGVILAIILAYLGYRLYEYLRDISSIITQIKDTVGDIQGLTEAFDGLSGFFK